MVMLIRRWVQEFYVRQTVLVHDEWGVMAFTCRLDTCIGRKRSVTLALTKWHQTVHSVSLWALFRCLLIIRVAYTYSIYAKIFFNLRFSPKLRKLCNDEGSTYSSTSIMGGTWNLSDTLSCKKFTKWNRHFFRAQQVSTVVLSYFAQVSFYYTSIGSHLPACRLVRLDTFIETFTNIRAHGHYPGLFRSSYVEKK